MDVKEAVVNRRSIRRYQLKPVPNELVAEVLEAAKYAPSSGNLQNWKVIIVSDEAKKEELATAALKQKWITQAPLLLVVCNEMANAKRLYKERGEKLYAIQNCAAFIQNILLMAQSLGLGTCWIGAFDSNAVKRVLKIPDDVNPDAIISLGYADEEVDTPPKNSLKQLVFFEEWGKTLKEFGTFPLEKHKAKVDDAKKAVGEKTKGFFGRLFSKE